MRDLTSERSELRTAFQEFFEHVSQGRSAGDAEGGAGGVEAQWAEIVEAGLTDLTEEGGTRASAIDAVILLSALGAAGIAQPVAASALTAAPVLQVLDGHPDLLQRVIGGARVCVVDAARGEGAYASTAELFLVAGAGGASLAERDAVTLGAHRGPDVARDLRAVSVDLTCAVAVGDGSVSADIDRRRRLGEAAELVGVLDAILAQTLAYVSQRRQFGREIGSFQAIKHGLVGVVTQLEASRALVFRAARLVDEGSADAERALLSATARLAHASRRAITVGFQYHGAIAHTWELELHHWLKRAMGLQLSDAAVARARETVAAAILD